MKTVFLLLAAALFLTACGSSVSYTTKPKDGTNCTTAQTSSGAAIKCEDGTVTYLQNGSNGTNGQNLLLKSGLKCSVYDSASTNRNNGLISILASATPKFTKVINIFDVGDSVAANGFPKFTAQEQALIGTEDYALDCDGYINIPVSNIYNFRVLSDDNVRLAVNSVTLINSDSLHAPTWDSSSPTLLYKGLNKINILYYQGPLTQIALTLQISGATSSGFSTLQNVPASVLFNM